MFRNRGNLPNIETKSNNGNSGNGGYDAPHYSYYRNRPFYVVQYDKNFVAIEVVATLIILLIVFAAYLFTYQVSFQDPIAKIKGDFLTAQLISIGISIVATGIITFFTKSSKENLIRNLRIIALVSAVIIVILFGVKLSIDNKYNSEDVFSEFYEKYEQPNEETEKPSKIKVSPSELKILSLKESYIKDSVSAYTNFSVKAMMYMGIHMAIIVIIFYLSCRLATIEEKKERLAKDDEILYDEEENIKF